MDNPQIDSSPKMQKATISNEKVVSNTASASESEGSSGSLADYPMENNYKYVHGRVDPGFDESIHLVEGIAVRKSLEEGRRDFLTSSDVNQEATIARYKVSQGMSHVPCVVYRLPRAQAFFIVSRSQYHGYTAKLSQATQHSASAFSLPSHRN